MRRPVCAFAAAVVVLFSIAAPSARATPFTFNFNSLADGANNAGVQTYMNGVLGAAGTVTVTGAVGEKDYNGDNHVVGPGAVSETLGTSDGGVHHNGSKDTFITNIGGGSSPNDRIVMKFSFPIYEVSFDYEIFPDSTCTDLAHCGTGSANLPDLKFKAGNPPASPALVAQWFGAVPGSSGGSAYLHSPNSGLLNNELTPQLLGLSGTWAFPGGVKELDFIDWPQKIGIDNLQVNNTNSRQLNIVPEPSTLLLLGSGLAGVVRAAWKKRS